MIVSLVDAQTSISATAKTDEKNIPSDIRAWRIDERLGIADSCELDTAIVSYQDNQPVNNYSIAHSWNGNLGSPVQSKIYFDRITIYSR